MLKESGQVKVKFLQEDMKGFSRGLQYPANYSMDGSQYFKEEVVFAEVWIYSLKSRREYYGRIVSGLLYLYNSKLDRFEGPAELSIGKYKIWVDAWILKDLNKDFYQTSFPFTTSDWKVWKSSDIPKPKLKEWQTITVREPKSDEGLYCNILVKSRRFHWLYRLDSLLSVLGSLMQSYESLSRDAMAFQEIAIVMNNFLSILKESDNNLGVWVSQGPLSSSETYIDLWEKMMEIVYYPADYTGKWILGLDYENPNIMNKIKHLNNVASLFWHFLEQREFVNALKVWDKSMPEEARVIVSMIGPALARDRKS